MTSTDHDLCSPMPVMAGMGLYASAYLTGARPAFPSPGSQAAGHQRATRAETAKLKMLLSCGKQVAPSGRSRFVPPAAGGIS